MINVGDPARLARFRRELEITVRLGRQHPHIVTVIDTGTAPGGRPCIVMEYYDLGSLHDRLRQRGPLPVPDVITAGTAVADALAFAHAQGFLHRDVKPQNILILPTSYVLADFGIARMADAGHTTSLQMVSYRHAAPQMIDGQSPAAADDLWSLGSTLFTLLDGAPPFASDNPDEDTVLSYLDRVRASEPRPIRRPDIPPELTAVISRCLSKRREERFPDATALRAALVAIDAGTGGWSPAIPAFADFGPRPDQAPVLPEPPPPARSALDSERTTLGPGSDLAGLTVRLPDEHTALPDFGPRSPEYRSAEYPLPVQQPWEQAEPPQLVRAPKRRGRRALLLGLAAILLGGAIGVIITVFNDLRGQQAQPPASTPTSTPDSPPPSTPSTPSIPPPTQGGDPAFAPTLNRLEDKGTSITLIWSDPTGGKAQFVVVDVTGTRREALATVAAGATTFTVDNLDPAAKEYCFQVLGIGLDDPMTQRGSSAPTCTSR